MPTQTFRPALSWPGGKRRLAKYILPAIPEHRCYVEAFAGGLAILCAKPFSEVEVINDVHADLVTFYRCVRFHPEALLAELRGALHSRREFADLIAQPGLTDLQRASRWFLRNRTCFGGDMRSFGTSALSSASSTVAWMEAIKGLHERLDRVVIESLDWQRCLSLYDRPTTFFFCDPPYTTGNCGLYPSWTVADVHQLRRALAALAGSWMVTLDDTDANREIFSGCQIRAIERATGINNRAGTARGRKYKEIIITPSI